MRRVLVVGLVVGIADGALLGASAALGWTWVAWAALLLGLGGAALVALTVPPPRVPRPATVTLGLPLRDEQPAEEPVPAAAAVGATVDAADVPAAVPAGAPAEDVPGAVVEEYPRPVRTTGEPTPAAA
ncbi:MULTISPECIES: hypothetical protein [unclassified Isoptericola]|uniref:hypothetical protein n=1 Tax=unclassified Isoptericola TaxID=2623355 RepID=UPI003657F723